MVSTRIQWFIIWMTQMCTNCMITRNWLAQTLYFNYDFEIFETDWIGQNVYYSYDFEAYKNLSQAISNLSVLFYGLCCSSKIVLKNSKQLFRKNFGNFGKFSLSKIFGVWEFFMNLNKLSLWIKKVCENFFQTRRHVFLKTY